MTARRNGTFTERVSAAGWVDRDTLLIASESSLFRYNLVTGEQWTLAALEAEKPIPARMTGAPTAGRVLDRHHGQEGETGMGAIWRYHRGTLRKLYPRVSIPKSMCFTLMARPRIFRTARSASDARGARQRGWHWANRGLCRSRPDKGEPDGAVVDEAGNLWLAEWGMSRVCCYAPMARFCMSSRRLQPRPRAGLGAGPRDAVHHLALQG